MNAKLSLAAAALMLTAAAAPAQTLANRDAIAQDKVNLADYAKRVNSDCGGTHIQFSVDYASFNAAPGGVDEHGHAPYLLLENAGDAIINICKTEAGKAAVAEKIKSVVLHYTEGEEESLSGGVFSYKIGYHGGNVDNPEKWLKAHL